MCLKHYFACSKERLRYKIDDGIAENIQPRTKKVYKKTQYLLGHWEYQ